MSKVIHASGKRKTAIARATLTSGNGKVRINNMFLNEHGNVLSRARISEPLILAGDAVKKFNIAVNVTGGGLSSQADAARLAIGRALAQHNDKMKLLFLDYDRQLIVADVRRKEPAKPNSHGNARAKRQKSYR